MRDAAVVGGGPAGTIAARLLAKGHDVVVLEEHPSSGVPLQCAGLVTQKAVDLCGVSPDVLSRIRGTDVIFPGGGKVEVRAKGVMALLIDRPDLDRKLAEKAADCGAEIRYGTKYLGHRISASGAVLATNDAEIEAKMIIGADGYSSAVAMSLGNNLPKEYVLGIQADAAHRPEHDDIMVLRLGSEIAPGFFSWEIPFGDMTRIGLCMSGGSAGTPNDHLKKLLKESGIDGGEVVSRYSGKIPLGGRPRSYGDRVLLIGDAAGQVKPVSGGGLYPICKAAPILGRTAEESLRANDTSMKFLSIYEKRWKKELGKELSRGYRIRKAFTGMSDGDLEKIYGVIDRDNMRQILNNIDLDNPSGIAFPMMRDPLTCFRLLPFLLRAVL